MPAVTVTDVAVIDGYVVLLTFDDGETRIVNLEPLMTGPIFDQIKDTGLMSQVFVDPELGTIAWPNGADLPPHRLLEESVSFAKWARVLRRASVRPRFNPLRGRVRAVGAGRAPVSDPFDELTAAFSSLALEGSLLDRQIDIHVSDGTRVRIEIAASVSSRTEETSAAQEREARRRFRSSLRPPVTC